MPAEMMKAVTCRAYGGPEVVQIEQMPRPAPGSGELVIRVMASAVNAADWRLRSLQVPKGFAPMVRLAMGWSGLRNPVLGFDAAGIVEEIGAGRSDFAPGDRVLVSSEAARGAHAQVMCLPKKALVLPLPEAVSFDQAAALVFGGHTAAHFLDKAGAKAGQNLLINGASGTVGLALVALAKRRGMRVTGVCSGRNRAIVAAQGADEVIDYTTTPFAEIPGQWDMVADLAGTAPWGLAREKITPGGRYLMIEATSLWHLASAGFRGGQGRKIIAGTAQLTVSMLADLVDWVAMGGWNPVIDSTYPLTEARAAHARVESRRKVGSVLLHPQE